MLSTNSCYIASNAWSAVPSCHFILPRELLCCKLQVRRASLITAVQKWLPSDKPHCIWLETWMRKQPLSHFKGNLSERKFEETDRLGGGGWKGGGKGNERGLHRSNLFRCYRLFFYPEVTMFLRKYYQGMFFNNTCSEEPEG